ncbi:MAG: DUF962 domain-containing protein [Polyangiaceae bacterium]
MSEARFRTFEEFWPFYVREHSRLATRRLHFVGTTVSVTALATGLLTGRKWLAAIAPVFGYGPAWISHFFIEHNRPATFKYPAWSLQADFKMWSLMVRGAMDAEVERVMAEPVPVEGQPVAGVGQDGGPVAGADGDAHGRVEMSRERGNGAAHRETMN